MSAADIDAYLAGVPEPARSALEETRCRILALLPDAGQCISYSHPGFRVGGKVIAGLAAFKKHNSYLPHSGSVLPALAEDLAGYEQTKGSLHFPLDEPLPFDLVRKLISTRLEQAGLNPREDQKQKR